MTWTSSFVPLYRVQFAHINSLFAFSIDLSGLHVFRERFFMVG